MFKSYYHKNILKTSVLLWGASKSCYVIYDFVLHNNCGEEHQYATSSFLCFLKKPALENKEKKSKKKSLTLIT